MCCLASQSILIGLLVSAAQGAFPTDAYATDPYIASNLLGQTDQIGQPSYTDSWTNNVALPYSGGLEGPYSIAIDTVHHLLYADEVYASRVQVYQLDSNNHLASRQSLYELGESQYLQGSAGGGCSQSGLYQPKDVAIDSADQLLYVADTSNNRVLVYNTADLSNDENAAYVIGQPNFTTCSSAVSQTRLAQPSGVAYDASNHRLFVSGSSQVLVYDTSAIATGMAASNVIGAPNFAPPSGHSPTQTSLGSPVGLTLDSNTGELFVADNQYNRVMVYDANSISDGMVASHVLGQTDFTSTGAHETQSGLYSPTNVAIDSAHNVLYVSDSHRVLAFSTAGLSDGEDASHVLGVNTFTDNTGDTTQNALSNPKGLAFDPTNRYLYVADVFNNRIMIFDASSVSDGQDAINEMGQTTAAGAVNWTSANSDNQYTNPTGLSSPEGVAEDTTGHRLFVADASNGRVLVYNLDNSNNVTNYAADNELGAPDLYTTTYTMTQSSMDDPSALAFDPSRNWLYVADGCRVLVFDTSNITNGEPALYVLGEPDFNSDNCDDSAKDLSFIDGLTYDNVHQRLFVADTGNNRVMVYDMASPSNAMSASYVIGQSDFTSDSFIADDKSMDMPEGAAYDSVNNRLYVADALNDRILVFNMDNLADGMAASYVLGQPNLSTYDTPNVPSQNDFGEQVNGLWFDPTSQHLWASDFDGRLLMFDTSKLANFMNADFELGAPDFVTQSLGISQSEMVGPAGIYVDPTNERVYAADEDAARVLIFDTIHITQSSLPDGTNGQSYAWTVTSAGSEGTVRMTIASGQLPPGLSMDSNGLISGTPTSAGTFNFTVGASDDNSSAGTDSYSQALSITVDAQTTQSQSSPQSPSLKQPAQQNVITASQPTTSLNSDPDFSNGTGSVQTMSAGKSATFSLPGSSETHTATVNDVTSDSVDLTVRSNPIHVHLTIGQTEDIDVNDTGKNDLGITLLGIVGNKAELSFKSLQATSPQTTAINLPTAKTPSLYGPSKHKSSRIVYVLPVVIIASIVVVGAVIVRKRRYSNK